MAKLYYDCNDLYVISDTGNPSYPYHFERSGDQREYQDDLPPITYNTIPYHKEQNRDRWHPQKYDIDRQADEGFRTVSKQCRLVRNRRRCRPRINISRSFDIYQEGYVLSQGNIYRT